MQMIKKFLAVLVLLLAFPLLAYIATHLMLRSSKTIYEYIPETSDIVIEINTRNFISEVMYQRIFREDYFHEKVEIEPDLLPSGVDLFSSVVVFREQWAEENVWMALIGYTDQEQLKSYLHEKMPDAHYQFTDDYVLLQISPSSRQESVDNHMEKIIAGEVPSFDNRVNLGEIFDRDKEINCYILPQNENNKFISGNLSFDFLEGEIKVEGEFIPVSGFSENPPVAYALNEESALSIRSSLNIMQSIDWLIREESQPLPDYTQLALDYEGMKMFMIDEKLGYPFAFKIFPEMQLHFDIVNSGKWSGLFDTLRSQGIIKTDTAAHTLVEKHGIFLSYEMDQSKFELMRSDIRLTPSEEEDLYFAFHLKVAPMIDHTRFAVDEENPPATLLQELGLNAANAMVEELLVMANIDHMHFELRLQDETTMMAHGNIQMVNVQGNSIIESMNFGKAAIDFFTSYLSGVETEG